MADPDAPTRLRGLLPASWFGGGETPVLDTVLAGLVTPITWARGLYGFVLDQARLRTSRGVFLDLFALDFFGSNFPRRSGEADGSYQERIEAELTRPRATREAMRRALFDLTGHNPELYEPWNAADCGAYDVGTLAYSGAGAGNAPVGGLDVGPGAYDIGGLAYAVPGTDVGAAAGAGCYGSYELPNQVFVRVHRGVATFADAAGCGAYDMPGFAYGGGVPGNPQYAGLDSPLAWLDVGPLGYFDTPAKYGTFSGIGFLGGPDTNGSLSDDEIYRTVAATVPAGVVAWTQIVA